MFITPGTKVYGGMVVGVCPKSDDMPVNVCRTKHLTNTRASGSDEALRLVPAQAAQSGAVPGVPRGRRAS